MKKAFICMLLACSGWVVGATSVRAQNRDSKRTPKFSRTQKSSTRIASDSGSWGSLEGDLKELVETPAVSGYEQELAAKIRARLEKFSPQTDNLGDVLITIGSGSPHRLIAAPIDEPGFVVSGLTEDGYVRVQRLPQGGLFPLYNELWSAQPVRIKSAQGKWIDGVVAGLSVHLQPGRLHPPDEEDLDDMYIDVGATSAEEARRGGADYLSPIVLDRHDYVMGFGKHTSVAIGDRFGAAALLELLRDIDPARLKGTLTLAFVTQQWTGARGLERVLTVVKPDEMLYIGRLTASGPVSGMQSVRRAPRRELGSGVLLGMAGAEETLAGFPAELKLLADASKIPFEEDYSAPLMSPSYIARTPLPERWAHLGIATAWPLTPAEMIDSKDLSALAGFLDSYVGVTAKPESAAAIGDGVGPAARPQTAPPTTEILRQLVGTYGVSGHEESVREKVKFLLPPWAKPETDPAGNLVLHLGTPAAGSKTPRILVVAHMDEIGFEVKSVASDGRLEIESRGGGAMEFFAGHPVLVHSSNGVHPGVLELPASWDAPEFKWPRGREAAYRVDVGARSPQEVLQLGITKGDFITVPKKYRKLMGTRANGRSFDDRVGCASLVSAAWALGPNLKDRDVTFLFSTGEETGLVGAAAAAKRLYEEGKEPDFVFAVDTFVSSDSPLESKRFGDAILGKGFVSRAVDNSNVTPREDVEKLLALAKANQIPMQYGVTGGGNDGSAYLRYGAVDVALGWPLRYSHSSAEVIDSRDLDALAQIVTVVARSW
ncbi:MAG: M20/M25/M40 family metallo-hydrolase [Candidatus Acidiferrales bacterium]